MPYQVVKEIFWNNNVTTVKQPCWVTLAVMGWCLIFKKMGKTFKSIDELIKEENPFISSIPNNLGINLCSVEGIEYERRNDGQLESLKILFLPDIKDINLIDTSTSEGKLLLAAVAKITTESQTDKTPYEVMEQLMELSAKMK